MVWQTYDYYFEPTAAYFGCKKACEPLHIQWNAFTDSIEVVNYSVANSSGLIATMEIMNIDGAVKLKKQIAVNCPEDSMVHCFLVPSGEATKPEGLSGVQFIRLKLTRGKEIISENFYWRGLAADSLKIIRNLPKVKLGSKKGGACYLITKLSNNTKTPAFLVKLKVVGEKSGEQILPVIFSDNYVSLMPGERRTIKIEFQNADTRGEKPVVVAEGINVE
jgi:hypothetical protein